MFKAGGLSLSQMLQRISIYFCFCPPLRDCCYNFPMSLKSENKWFFYFDVFLWFLPWKHVAVTVKIIYFKGQEWTCITLSYFSQISLNYFSHYSCKTFIRNLFERSWFLAIWRNTFSVAKLVYQSSRAAL